MRDKSLLWIGLGVAGIGALFAANLAMRPDPEPEFTPVSRPVPERPSVQRLTLESPPEEPSAPDSEAPAEPEEPVAPSSESAALGCEHPFVPSAPGTWRRYTWQQSGEQRAAELRIEALSARELDDGQREITWRVQVTAVDDHDQLASERMTTRCAPGRDAEEPWFGILERSLSLRLTDAPRWRWPARLRTGDRFEGTAVFDPEGSDMRRPADVQGPLMLRVTRTHVVGEQEAIEVGAGRYRAWRVDYEERHAFGERGEQGTGSVWVAPEVGLVKLRAENSQGVVQTIELTALGPNAR